jgi:hypothetical protein
MAGWIMSNASGRTIRRSMAGAAALLVCTLIGRAPAAADADIFQQAINYVFTGKAEPSDALDIVDRKSCVIVLHDPQFNRYVRYYLNRFNMDDARFDKRYVGQRVINELNVKGDDVVAEYLGPDRQTVIQGYRSIQISLPGDIDQTRKGLRIIFADYCKAEKPKAPF